MRNKEHVALKRLMNLLNSGTDFYRHAERELNKEHFDHLARIFNSMAFAREASLADLQPFITKITGHAEDGHSMEVDLRQKYADLLARVKNDPQNVYVEYLEDIEDATLEAIDTATLQADDTALVQTLAQVRDRMTICQEQMHQLHHNLA